MKEELGKIILKGGLIPLFLLFSVVLYSKTNSFSKRYSLSVINSIKKGIQIGKSSNNLTISYYKKIDTDHFIIYYGKNLPYTTFWNDYNKNNFPDYIDSIKEILEYVYNYEVNYLGFDPPINKCYVIIGNTDVKINSKKINIDSSVCGYSYKINDNNILVLNPIPPSTVFTKSKKMLKITIAHEFFHIIQFGYSLNITNKNLWLYEGTAVWMENQVFPDIDDYIYSYVDDFIHNISISLISDKGYHVYGTALFFDYLSNKYGSDIIKHIWEYFKNNGNSLKSVKEVLKDIYNVSFSEEIYDFYNALLEPEKNFSDGDKLNVDNFNINPIILKSNILKEISVELLGAIYFKGECNYLGIFNFNKNLIILNKLKYKCWSLNILNKKDINILIPYIDNFDKIEVNKLNFNITGINSIVIEINPKWNLIGIPDNILDINFFNKKFIQIIWFYKNNQWEIYVPEFNKSFKEILKNYKISELKFLFKGSGIWLYAKNKDYIKFNKISTDICNLDYDNAKNWQIKSTSCISNIPVKIFSSSKIKSIWKWKNNKWNIWSSDESVKKLIKLYKISEFETLNIKEGFWIN